MTRIQAHFALARPLDDTLAQAVAGLPGNYGIYFARVAPGLDELMVEYDASRLSQSRLEALLRGVGIPVSARLTTP